MSRYVIDSEALTKVNSKYFNEIDGLINMTAAYGTHPYFSPNFSAGIPVFMSLPQMYGVDSAWASTVQGMQKVSYNDVRSYFDVEKYTGIGNIIRIFSLTFLSVQGGHARQQINFLLGNGTNYFNVWYTNVTQGVLYPISISDEHKKFTESESNWYEDNIYSLARVSMIILICGLVFGSLLFVAGAVFFYLQYRQNQKMKRYQLIQ